jgi:NADH dehydrogenase/NADH:ubiquinone oxidoreductase subunit G
MVVTLKIDGKEVRAKEGMTILEAAKKVGIEIPTLCYHEGLEPYGVCRICSVEIERKGKVQVVAACCYPVEEGLNVVTNSPRINKLRKVILELAAASAGEGVSGKMRALASEYGANLSRFRPLLSDIEPTRCILCGLCVRRCVEANWDAAIGFIGRGVNRRIVIFPEKETLCLTCRYCRDVCPTGRACPSYGPNPPFPTVDDVIAGRA